MNQKSDVFETAVTRRQTRVADQCDQIGRFIGHWATFKVFGNN